MGLCISCPNYCHDYKQSLVRRIAVDRTSEKLEQGHPTSNRHDAKAVRRCMDACVHQSIPRSVMHQHCNKTIHRTFTVSDPARLTASIEAHKSTFAEHVQYRSHRCAYQARNTRSKQDIYPSDLYSTFLAAACLPNSTLSKPAVSLAFTTAGMNVCRRSEVTKAPCVST